MPTLTIDNITITVPEGTTVLEAAAKIGINIPTLCYVKSYKPQTSCMVCLVRINGARKLVPSCGMLCEESMQVESQTPEIIKARRTALELLLGDHRGDCMAPCQDACPAHVDIPQMITLLSRGDAAGAIKLIKDRLALPATLSRICAMLCEKGCRRSKVDLPIAICSLMRFAADRDLFSEKPYRLPERPDSGNAVAVIGAGTAGLSAAYFLAAEGHRVTVHDRNTAAGGSLRAEVAAGRLEQSILDAEIAGIADAGVEFCFSSEIGSISDLSGKYAAVVICTGKATIEGIACGAKGIETDSVSAMTDIKGVFAAGSAVVFQKHAIRAAAQGGQVAKSVSSYIITGEAVPDGRPYSVRMGQLHPGELEHLTKGASAEARVEKQELFEMQDALVETGRCLHCECAKLEDCRLRNESIMYSADLTLHKAQHRHYTRDTSHPDIVFEPSKCISCGLCVQVCQRGAEELGLTFYDRGFDVRLGGAFNSPLPEALKQMGLECARVCPTAALHVKREAGVDG